MPENSKIDMLDAYVSPSSLGKLIIQDSKMVGHDNSFPFLSGIPEGYLIPDFVKNENFDDSQLRSLSMYNFEGARDVYRNFLAWLFETFKTDSSIFRKNIIERLPLEKSTRILVTGCGIGDDVIALLKSEIFKGSLYANDLSPEMVASTFDALLNEDKDYLKRVSLSVADATDLPFEDNFFDASFHFGGINLFGDIKKAISEMTRVTKNGGLVLFGDEGVSPWLKNEEYGKMVIANNYLWEHQPPIDMLPVTATDVSLSWILGNCFWLIQFKKEESVLSINIDVPHIGKRGGTMRTRYYGKLEGVSLVLKEKVKKASAEENISVVDWLETAIKNQLEIK